MENDDVPPPLPANNHHIKLPAFCPNNIICWFAMAEGQFVLRNVNDELIRYYNMLTAFLEATINFVADFVEVPLPADPYTQLRARLLVAHQLTDYQKVEFIKKMPSLGDQKPSELFAEMLQVCPRGQEGNIFFIHEFLSRLPKDLRLMLSGMDFADRRALANRADELWTHTARQHHDVVAAVADEEQAIHVAAVSGRSGQGGRANKKPPPPPSKKAPWKRKQLSLADQKTLDDSGLCYYHFMYADEATKCRKPCTWSGN
jgi:hypothetical protein